MVCGTLGFVFAPQVGGAGQPPQATTSARYNLASILVRFGLPPPGRPDPSACLLPDPALQISKALLGDDDRLKIRWDESDDAEVRTGLLLLRLRCYAACWLHTTAGPGVARPLHTSLPYTIARCRSSFHNSSLFSCSFSRRR